MIRAVNALDRESYLSLSDEFYHSEAVLSPVPSEHFASTWNELMNGTPFAKAYMFECEGNAVGYALLAITWSQEAGGKTVWIEELYLRPEWRGRGLGSEFFSVLKKDFPEAKRFRLEIEPENEGAIRLYQRQGLSFLPYQQMKRDF